MSKTPAIGDFVRSIGTLVAIEDVQPDPPPPPPRDFIFEQITARCELRRNGECIKDLRTLNDFYGLETSVSSAIDEMRQYAKDRGIGPTSEVEVVVIRIAERIRHRPSGRENFYDNSFIGFRSLDCGCKRGMPDPVETIVWTSRQPSSAGDARNE